jgi:hypothetical protein
VLAGHGEDVHRAPAHLVYLGASQGNRVFPQRSRDFRVVAFDAEAAWIDEKRKEKRLFHAIGDGRFIADGEKFSHRKIMREKLPEGV